MGDMGAEASGAVSRPWRMRWRLSSLPDKADAFLDNARLERGSWLAVFFAAGIASWFLLKSAWQWEGAIGGAVLLALAAHSAWRHNPQRANLKLAVFSCALAFAVGLVLIWARSALVGEEPLDGPRFGVIQARILERQEQPGMDRTRLILAMRDAREGRSVKVRVNVARDIDNPALTEGAVVRMKARLMPPSPPLLPGAYDFARHAWFEGFAATGTAMGPIEVVTPSRSGEGHLLRLQRRLSAHVRSQLPGEEGALAATLASGDRGAISPLTENRMRDAGLTHLLSISGLHVSALMMVAYGIVFRALAIWPWLGLRMRIPLAASIASASAGVAYTLLTGAEVPTVRSCIGALLVLLALSLGRAPLTMRLVAFAAIAVLFLWPEAVVGPSFQMSFAAVVTIVALHQTEAVTRFLAPRDESWLARFLRKAAMLFATGVAIEFALAPIVLFHFHKTGLYGAFANIVAIPLVTFVSMPLVALSLLADTAGLGDGLWWLAGLSLRVLLFIARETAAAPHSVALMPDVGLGCVLLFTGAGLWLALWRGPQRLWALVPLAVSFGLMALSDAPDVLITRDGRDLAFAAPSARSSDLIVLREGRADSFTRESLTEFAAWGGEVSTIADSGAGQCSRDFCAITLQKDGRDWRFLVAKSNSNVEERALSAACSRSDIVIAARWLPNSCRPMWLKADRRYLSNAGGVAIDLDRRTIRTVAQSQGDHGWWRPTREQP